MAHRSISLTKGYATIVDEEDFEVLAAFRWHAQRNASGRIYARRWASAEDRRAGSPRMVNMHRAIMDPSRGMLVHHINGDTLDNRRVNLAVCTPAENQLARPDGRGASRFRGVIRSGKRWAARTRVGGKPVWLGCFPTEEEAALAYRAAVRVAAAAAGMR